jgi:hypothetical protein
MSDIFDAPDESGTPLTPDEKRDLIPAYIATRRESNAAEQDNIARGDTENTEKIGILRKALRPSILFSVSSVSPW